MKLTKKIEQEVLKVYNTSWEAYLRGDLKTHAACLSSDFKIIGTTESENFKSKKAWLDFCKKTIHQVVGVVQMRNRKIKLDLVGDGIMVDENSAIYVLIESKWHFYSKLRVTTLMQKEKTGWKNVHQHGSLPDTRANEDETLATKEIKKENLQLREAVKRRTIELEEKNRELEIEAALERVRSRSLAMHKSDELTEVVAVLFEKLKELQIPFTATGIATRIEGSKDLNAFVCGDNADGLVITNYRLPYFENQIPKDFYNALEKQLNFFVGHYSKEEKDAFYNYVIENTAEFRHLPEDIKQMIFDSTNYTISTVAVKNAVFNVNDFEGKVLAENEIDIIKRFARVFDQTYTRFLDLQKAEAQAREAEIQLALERVRAKTMAMKTQSDLLDIIELFGEQLNAVGIRFDNVTFIEGPITKKRDWDLWSYAPEAENTTDKILIPYIETPYFTKTAKAVKEYQKTGQPIQVKTFTKKEKNEFLDHYWKHAPAVSDEFVKYVNATPGSIIVDAFLEEITVSMVKWNTEPNTVEELEIFERFAKEFRQTYIRFLDIKKAEAQAREAQIETALERVRAQAMAMHHSEDLGKTIQVYFEQLDDLIDSTIVRCGAGLLNKENTIADMSTASKSPEGETYYVKGTIDMQGHPLLDNTYDHWLIQKEYHHVLRGNEIKEYYQYITNQVAIPENNGGDELHFYFPMFTEGSFYVVTNTEVPEHELQIFRRFSSVLSLTYRRFNDLQKAEAQAREAKIEAALERVRSKSLAMHKSEELQEVVNTVSDNLVELGVKMDSANFNILYEGSRDMDLWVANIYSQRIHIPYLDRKPMRDMMDAREKGINSLQVACTYEEKNLFWNEAFETTGFKSVATAERKKYILESKCWTILWTLAKHCGIQLNSYSRDSYTDEEVEILKRFTNVFDQAYVRFLDLQKAEAQAREAQIEAALERVRSRSLAMHKSEELEQVIFVVSEQLQQLQFKFNNVSFGFDTEQMGLNFWLASPQLSKPFLIKVPYIDNPAFNRPLQSRKNGVDFNTDILSREENIQFLQHMFDYSDLAHIPAESKSFLLGTPGFARSQSLMKNTILTVGNYVPAPYSQEQNAIIKRFGNVFEQAYVRFLDLQKAEAQTREAVKQSSLDRIRGEIASMRTTQDLDRITPLIWKELTILKIPFVRCGVFIMDEPLQQMHAFLSTPEGKAIAAFHLPYDSQGRTREILTSWNNKQAYIEHWDETAFSELGDLLVQQGALPSKDGYLNTVPTGGLYLHCLPFLQGMLYVGNTVKFNEDEIELIQSVAEAFSTAYARYEDFNKLEAAKQQVDKALVDLKQTQQQLVQSEKMASLGELTAGIAHEIQNPLNFVNNFSEVSNELLDEMKEEIDKGNYDEVKAITDDVKQNLEKILHHGKRADGIVKGMLQHSRSSSGTKEPTDINVLADEYLRLAYHGLRAKDKSFNASMKTDFDESIGKINIVPQDIGRVILNLITNAFYVVAEKKTLRQAQGDNSYEPIVSISTHRSLSTGEGRGEVLIKVKDNGNGIPEHIKEKIFQPFFTTKPTGQGTGLGLSLSYDIVKAHGGELKVETKEGDGSTFIIQLPTN